MERGRRKIALDKDPLICQEYLEGRSSYWIAEKYGVNRTTIIVILKKNEIAIRGPSEARRTCVCDDSYFQSLDTEEKAYWLGFLMADGCVSGNNIVITLAARDRGHLEKFLQSVKSTRKIQSSVRMLNGKAFPLSKVALFSPIMVRDLNGYGVVPRKTPIAKPPQLPTELELHFWRGMIDGDGCLSFSRKPYNTYPVLSLVGTWEICAGFAQFADPVRTAKVRSKGTAKNFATVSYNGTKALSIAQLIYGNARIFLDRKMEIFQRWQSGIFDSNLPNHDS